MESVLEKNFIRISFVEIFKGQWTVAVFIKKALFEINLSLELISVPDFNLTIGVNISVDSISKHYSSVPVNSLSFPNRT